MAETEPGFVRVQLGIETEIPESRVPALIEVLGRLSASPLLMSATIGEEQIPMFEVRRPIDDPRVVSLDTFRRYYKEAFPEDKPSALPTRVFNRITAQLSPGQFMTDSKNKPVAMNREVFDALVQTLEAGRSNMISGDKTLAFLFGLKKWLPEVLDID